MHKRKIAPEPGTLAHSHPFQTRGPQMQLKQVVVPFLDICVRVKLNKKKK